MRKAARLLAVLLFWGMIPTGAHAIDDFMEIHGNMKHRFMLFYIEDLIIENNVLNEKPGIATRSGRVWDNVRSDIDTTNRLDMAYLLHFIGHPTSWLDFGIAFSNLGGSRNFEYAVYAHSPAGATEVIPPANNDPGQPNIPLVGAPILKIDIDNNDTPDDILQGGHTRGRVQSDADDTNAAAAAGSTAVARDRTRIRNVPGDHEHHGRPDLVADTWAATKLLSVALARMWMSVSYEDAYRFRAGRFTNPLVDPDVQFVWDEDRAIQGIENYFAAWGFRLWTIFHFETNSARSDGGIAPKSTLSDDAAILFFATIDYTFDLSDVAILLRADYMSSYGRDEIGFLIKSVWYLMEGYPLGVATTFYFPFGVNQQTHVTFAHDSPPAANNPQANEFDVRNATNQTDEVRTFGGMTKLWFGDLSMDDTWHASIYLAYFSEMSRIVREDDNKLIDVLLTDADPANNAFDTGNKPTEEREVSMVGLARKFNPICRFSWDRLTRMADALINETTKRGANWLDTGTGIGNPSATQKYVKDLLVFILGLDVAYRFSEYLTVQLEVDFGFVSGNGKDQLTDGLDNVEKIPVDTDEDPGLGTTATETIDRDFALYAGLVAILNW